MDSKLTDVVCTYTGGGIYICTARFDDTYLVTDFETYGTYDVPYDDINEKYDGDYDAHWKTPSSQLPTWAELLRAIWRSHKSGHSPNMVYEEVEHQMTVLHPKMFLRLDESEYDDRTDVNPERLEILSRFIEVFEDFLEERDIDVPNPEKKENPNASTIYGTDYGELSDRLESLLVTLGMM